MVVWGRVGEVDHGPVVTNQPTKANHPKILVVEDEPLVALELAERLQAIGCSVLGPAITLKMASSLLDSETPTAALLDFNILGESVTPIAERLKQAEVPFAVVTSYALQAADDEALQSAPIINKPLTLADIERTLRSLLSSWPP
jgi:DNA-binding response OmpR family regulator